MTAPQDPNSPATLAADAAATAGPVDSDDDVVDGELVEDGSGTLAAGDDSDDPEDISDAEFSNDDPTDTLAAADEAEDKPADTADDNTAAAGSTSESPSADSGATTGATQTDAAAPVAGQDKPETGQTAAAPGAGEDTPDADFPAGTDSPTLTPAIPLGRFAFPTTPAPAFDYTDAGIPTLSYVQDKIEKRLGTAQGSTELNESSSAGKQAADQQTERERLAKAKLDEIRKSIEGH